MPFEAYAAHTQQERDRWQMRKVISLHAIGEAYLEFPSHEEFLAWHMTWS